MRRCETPLWGLREGYGYENGRIGENIRTCECGRGKGEMGNRRRNGGVKRTNGGVKRGGCPRLHDRYSITAASKVLQRMPSRHHIVKYNTIF